MCEHKTLNASRSSKMAFNITFALYYDKKFALMEFTIIYFVCICDKFYKQLDRNLTSTLILYVAIMTNKHRRSLTIKKRQHHSSEKAHRSTRTNKANNVCLKGSCR
uniref:Uncharacterized protein n=1 Tax=Ixodes ricinus TaxID=34613 RepID=A0A6B0UHZ3_IXORI